MRRMKRTLLAIGAVMALTVGSTAVVVADAPADACAGGGSPFDGYSVQQAVRQLDLAGRDLSEYLQKFLPDCPPS